MATKAERLRLRRARGKKPKVQQFPTLIEKSYIRELRKRAARLRKMIEAKLLPVILAQEEERADSLRLDIDRELERLIFDLIEGVILSYERRIPDPRTLVQRIAREVSKFNRTQIERQVGSLLGLDILDTPAFIDIDMEDWISENLKLIDDLTVKYRTEISEVIVDGFRAGRRPESIAKDIEKRGDIDERRARLIARDQVEKLNAKINKQRQTSLGIKSYIWRTSRDDRVRPLHEDREGDVFQWDDPPSDGHPGEPVNCRCRPEPNIEELLTSLEADLPPE